MLRGTDHAKINGASDLQVEVAKNGVELREANRILKARGEERRSRASQ